MITKNIQYYDNNAQSFYDKTINLDLSDSYKGFISYLPEKAHILDAWCRAGRDTKYFLSQIYQVTAFDGSSEMVKLASKATGIDILHLSFQDMDFLKIYLMEFWLKLQYYMSLIVKQKMFTKKFTGH